MDTNLLLDLNEEKLNINNKKINKMPDLEMLDDNADDEYWLSIFNKKEQNNTKNNVENKIIETKINTNNNSETEHKIIIPIQNNKSINEKLSDSDEDNKPTEFLYYKPKVDYKIGLTVQDYLKPEEEIIIKNINDLQEFKKIFDKNNDNTEWILDYETLGINNTEPIVNPNSLINKQNLTNSILYKIMLNPKERLIIEDSEKEQIGYSFSIFNNIYSLMNKSEKKKIYIQLLNEINNIPNIDSTENINFKIPEDDKLTLIKKEEIQIQKQLHQERKFKNLALKTNISTTGLMNFFPYKKQIEKVSSQKLNKYFSINGKGKIILSKEDLDFIEFLSKFRYSTTSILKNLHLISEEATFKQLKKLKVLQLVDYAPYPGIGILWFLTKVGSDLTGNKTPLVNNSNLPKATGLSPNLAAQWVASFLWNNTANVLNLKNFPANNKIRNGLKLQGEELISESQIRSGHTQLIKKLVEENEYKKAPFSGYYAAQVELKKKELFNIWNKAKEYDPEIISPEFISGNEFCFNIYPGEYVTGQTNHPADLVVKRPRIDGKPQSIAVEVERKTATVEDYTQTFLCYKYDSTVFTKVVWITNSEYVAQRIAEGARNAGFKDYVILPFMDENGAINYKTPWEM